MIAEALIIDGDDLSSTSDDRPASASEAKAIERSSVFPDLFVRSQRNGFADGNVSIDSH